MLVCLAAPASAGTGAFAFALTNVAAEGALWIGTRVIGVPALVTVKQCQTNPTNAQCLTPPQPWLMIFSVRPGNTERVRHVRLASIPFDPAHNRVFVEIRDVFASASAERAAWYSVVRA